MGFWHGAAWGMIIFGFLHGLYLTYDILTYQLRNRVAKVTKHIAYLRFRGVLVFFLFVFSAVSFRAQDTTDMFTIYGNFFKLGQSNFSMSTYGNDSYTFFSLVILTFIFALVEAFQGKHSFISDWLNTKKAYFRWAFYIILMLIILNFGLFSNKEYIYFQF